MKLLLIGAGFNPIPAGMMCLCVEERIASGAALPHHNKPPPLPAGEMGRHSGYIAGGSHCCVSLRGRQTVYSIPPLRGKSAGAVEVIRRLVRLFHFNPNIVITGCKQTVKGGE